ncbi:hypothetical protein BDV29DRAFT_738 [Aspergillus leporis]|uniref:Uncharacterized protein n=1 Tax=Aspergillus leporis TaxID=41062 RepID=A0A5N5XFV6_9EURO|nr:hypothetical protein BDV29DRAFT_738 [Aspergillus leporis]
MSCLAYNKRVYNVMGLDRRLWEPFTYCQLFSSVSMAPLRSSLVRISQDWDLLGLPGRCPFGFTEEELKEHDMQVLEYQDRLYLLVSQRPSFALTTVAGSLWRGGKRQTR